MKQRCIYRLYPNLFLCGVFSRSSNYANYCMFVEYQHEMNFGWSLVVNLLTCRIKAVYCTVSEKTFHFIVVANFTPSPALTSNLSKAHVMRDSIGTCCHLADQSVYNVQ